jgi:hypothetical protein
MLYGLSLSTKSMVRFCTTCFKSPKAKAISTTHAVAIGHWLAPRASERELLPMILDAGRFLHMKGFDWVEEDITPSQFLRKIPVIYAAWSSALPNSLDKVEELAQMELQICIDRLGWERDFLLTVMSNKNITTEMGAKRDVVRMRCSRCEDDYTSLGVASSTRNILRSPKTPKLG